LRRSRYICPRVGGHMGRVYQGSGEADVLASFVSLVSVSSHHHEQRGMCFKRPPVRQALSRKHDVLLFKVKQGRQRGSYAL
jgi:hypothetical protein